MKPRVGQKRTLRLLRDGHAKPLHVHTVLAADARRATAKRMQRDGAHNQRKLQGKFGRPRNINTNLLKYQVMFSKIVLAALVV